MACNYGFLRALQCLADVADDTLKSFADLCNVESYENDAQIFDRGDPSTAVYVVLQGAVAILAGSGPTRKTIARVVPGELFGEMGVIETSARTAQARAENYTMLLVCPASSFDDLMAAAPGFAMQIMMKITRRYDDGGVVTKSSVCSFCRRSEAEVMKLIDGPEASICDRCVREFRDRARNEPPIN